MRLAAVIIALFPLVTFLAFHDRKDLFGPKNIFFILYLFGILIPTLYYSDSSNAAGIGNASLSSAVLNDDYYLTYVILQTLSYHCVLAGIGVATSHAGSTKAIVPEADKNMANIRIWAALFILLGMGAFALMMGKVGGLFYFISHLQYRTIMTRDLDLYSWLLPFAQYGCLLLVASRGSKRKPITAPIVLLIVATGLMCGLGGRKALIILVVECFIIYHYAIHKMTLSRLLSIRNIVAALFILAFFVVFTNLRTDGSFESLVSNPTGFLQGAFTNLTASLVGESYVPFYVKVVSYFDSHELWGGLSFLGLFTAIIPSSLFPGKPPVDDGAYLYSIALGRGDIVPPMPFSQLDGSSYPLETFGSMYANFGVAGLLVGMVLLGYLYGRVYTKMQTSSYSLFWIVLYTQVMFTFQISTLRIFQLLQCIALLLVVTKAPEILSFVSRHRGKRSFLHSGVRIYRNGTVRHDS